MNPKVAASIIMEGLEQKSYVIIPKFLSDKQLELINVDEIERILKESPQLTNVFQTTSSRNQYGDMRRKQLYSNDESLIPKEIQTHMTRLAKYLGNFKLSTPAILMSLPGCQEQCLHTDYDPSAEKSSNCIICIIALEENTRLIGVVNDKKLSLPLRRGEAILCTGDFIHAGSAYEKRNIRIHYYFDCVSHELLRPQSSDEEDITYKLTGAKKIVAGTFRDSACAKATEAKMHGPKSKRRRCEMMKFVRAGRMRPEQ